MVASGTGLAGVMVTAFDDERASSVTVVAAADGRYRLPPMPARSYRVRATRLGWRVAEKDVSLTGVEAVVDFVLDATDDLNAQLPANYFYSLLEWPTQRVKGDFSRACANCHQIGDHVRWKRRSRDDWEVIVNRMIGYGGVPFFDETREVLLDTIATTFSPQAPQPSFAVPAAITGDAARAVIYEWEIDPDDRPSCHDLEIGLDGTVYAVSGLYAIHPETLERSRYPVRGGGHSIERDANGDMWITAPGPEQMIKFDVATKQFTHFDQPRIGDDLGSYPHTLRFDDRGRIWYSLARSNHVCKFDPATEEFTYYRLPAADPEVSGVPIAVAYGCDVAPDQSVWWSQLFGHRIGRVDPETGQVSSWRPPFDGPRRLRVGPDNVVWVPGYGAGVLGKFDPRDESWRVYDLPNDPPLSDLPYAVAVNRDSGDVWVTGSNSDTILRFEPERERWTVFHLPTPVNFTREIEFDDDGAIWTCTSNQPSVLGEESGSGRVIKLVLQEREGVCGDGVLQLGEDCDDGNAVDCDGCSAHCVVETGCGDGVLCGDELCEDGGNVACDGCSVACIPEVGWLCGDMVVNTSCREQCDPPGEFCTDECLRVPVCGDALTEGDEECDDGNLTDCDGCSGACSLESGCGDGVRCGAEQCDDANEIACDGCFECVAEVGEVCGDGVVNAKCGEKCDPPGPDCSPICTLGNDDLGTRHLSFGGEFFASPLGPDVPLGELSGEIDLVAGSLAADGTAPVSIDGPVYYSSDILGGTFGFYCVRVDSCTGFIDCDGGTPVDVVVVQDSNGSGSNGLPVRITIGQGESGLPGSLQLSCQQTFVQLQPGAGSDCANATYPVAGEVVYTTGTVEGFFLNGAPKVGSGAIVGAGERFECGSWTVEDGRGVLASVFLVENDSQAGDVANLTLLDD